ncbi:universal stress protein [Pedobacter sp. AW31-3R]|uniref:universal stress protein n=1 Tax=Pedobacter sp. AW31-3R TaxID=3445781 RepID=UPI003FA0670C
MNTIIAATDYSYDATNAVEYAASLCKQMDARLVLYNSFVIPVHAANTLLPAQSFQHISDANTEVLRAMAKVIADKYEIEVLFETSLTEIREELDRLVKKYAADMVVMGMKGSSLEQKMFGNTTTAVIAHATYPVLSVPSGLTFNSVKKVLFACDVTCELVDSTIGALNKIFDGLHAQIEVFYVNAKIEAVADELFSPDVLAKLPLSLQQYDFKEVHGVQIIKSIREEAKSFGADMLVMVPQRYKFWESILHVSRTRSLASQGEIPLLSVPNRK